MVAVFGVYKRFFLSGEAKISNLAPADFCAVLEEHDESCRREQPNAGLNLGVRTFVRSVSHAKVLVARLFGLFFFNFAFITETTAVRNNQ